MADLNVQVEEPNPQDHTPFLVTNQTQNPENVTLLSENDDHTTQLDKTLNRLDSFLSLLGFHQSSVLSFVLFWAVFLVIGVAVPVLVLVFSDCVGCVQYQIQAFELDIVVLQACLAAASLLCLSHHLRKHGIRKFLFVDRHSGHVEHFSDQYIQKIYDHIHLLVLWILPCFLLKIARELIRMLHVPHESWWQSIAILLALVVSWTYVSTVFLSACTLFHLVCNLQIIHFDDYGKLLERESDVWVLIQEHVCLRYYLSKISHRFRIYLLLVFVIVTTTLFVILYQVMGYGAAITYINGGDFAVSSIVQVVGTILCLNAAAKISHRAQGIASLATRWHAVVTCSSGDTSQVRAPTSSENLQAFNPSGLLHISNSESDLESLNHISMPTNTQLASYMASYHKRQALVMYLQNNTGGITIFGWTVDRGLINTIFFLELSLVLFVLGKTIIFPPQ